MNWKNSFNYFLLILIFLGGVYFVFFYFFLPQQNREKKENIAHQKATLWQSRLEHARMESYLKQYDKAESEYQQLLKERPDSIDVKIELATLLYYKKQYDNALDLLDTIPPDKRTPQILLLRAHLYFSEKNLPEAEFLYREYLQSFPLNKEILIRLAEVLTRQKKYEEAVHLYQYILADDPGNTKIRRYYAQTLIWMGKYAKGVEELKKTLPEESSKKEK